VRTSRARRLRPVLRKPRPHLRPLLISMGAALAALVVVVVWTAGSVTSDPGPQALPDSAPAAVEGEDDVEAAESADEPVLLPLVTYELFLARDPFEPVVPEPAPSAPNAQPSAPTDPSDPDAPPADPNSTENSDTAPAPSRCVSGTEVVCDGRVITVIEVFEQNGEMLVILQVDTMRYEVRAGDVVLDTFEIVSVSADEVRVLVGDRLVEIIVGDNALK